MIELLQITNDPALAARCDRLGGFRLFVDLERLGKAQRQAGRSTFISTHEVGDVARVKSVLRRTTLMVRVNPVHAGSDREIDAVLAAGADMLMLPMFHGAEQVHAFTRLVAGRAPVVPLLETAGALDSLEDWVGAPGLHEVYVGLNDLHISLGRRFMFEPLAEGAVDRVAAAARRQGIGFGFGGIARMDEGLLSGRDVLAEHLRLGSRAVILSRTFHRPDSAEVFEQEVERLREAERELGRRSAQEVEADRQRVHHRIRDIAAGIAKRA